LGAVGLSRRGRTLIACDGCGVVVPFADDRHIRERIERLELATRFRPVHIQILILDAAPPARPEDYFYRVAKDRSIRSARWRSYFDELASSSDTLPGSGMEEGAALDGFQRRGLFLAYLVECPVPGSADFAAAIKRTAPTLLKRLHSSYRPKRVALLSQSLQGLIPVLQEAGWGDRLLLDEGKPLPDPSVLRRRLAEVP